ncbi:hypothetical protein [Pseudomonas gingeri]
MTTLIELNSILAATERIKGGVARTAATLRVVLPPPAKFFRDEQIK